MFVYMCVPLVVCLLVDGNLSVKQRPQPPPVRCIKHNVHLYAPLLTQTSLLSKYQHREAPNPSLAIDGVLGSLYLMTAEEGPEAATEGSEHNGTCFRVWFQSDDMI